MKFILTMHCPRNAYEGFGRWPKPAVHAHLAFMNHFNQDLKNAGQWVTGEGLADPRQAKVVRTGNQGQPEVADSTADSFVAGFWIVQVDSAAVAYTLAARASSAPGPDSQPLNMPIEVREVPDGPPKELL